MSIVKSLVDRVFPKVGTAITKEEVNALVDAKIDTKLEGAGGGGGEPIILNVSYSFDTSGNTIFDYSSSMTFEEAYQLSGTELRERLRLIRDKSAPTQFVNVNKINSRNIGKGIVMHEEDLSANSDNSVYVSDFYFLWNSKNFIVLRKP